MEFVESYWLLILIVAVLSAVVAWYIFHAARRTRVTGDRRDVLDEGVAPAPRNQALIDAAPAAPAAAPTPPVREAAGTADDLTRLKGVGPKLAATLREMGIHSFAQIAGWSEADIDRVDAQLGRFQGRIRRDNWVEQAKLLAARDEAGFAARFGAIT